MKAFFQTDDGWTGCILRMTLGLVMRHSSPVWACCQRDDGLIYGKDEHLTVSVRFFRFPFPLFRKSPLFFCRFLTRYHHACWFPVSC